MRLPRSDEEFFALLGQLEQEIQQGQAEVALETLGLLERALGDQPAASFVYALQGRAHQERRRLAESCEAYEQALAGFRALGATPLVATTLNNLGNALSDRGRTAEAQERYEEALRLYRALAEEDPRAFNPVLASTLNNLGNALRGRGRTAEAQERYEEALRLRRALAEEDPRAFNPDVAMTLNNLGKSMNRTGSHGRAAVLERKAAATSLAVLATVHTLTEQEESLTRLVEARTEAAYALACLRRPGEAWAESRMARTAFRTLLTDDPAVRDLKLEVERLDQRIKLELTEVRALEGLLRSSDEENALLRGNGWQSRDEAVASLNTKQNELAELVLKRNAHEANLVKVLHARLEGAA